MKIHHFAVLALGGFFFAGCTSGAGTPTPSPETMQIETGTVSSPQMSSQTIQLEEQNDLGQTGQAVITEDADGNAVVTLTMTGGEFPDPQPAHIHDGSCPNPGAVKYPLTNVVDGASVTTLDVSYDDLVNSTEKLAVNVHKSAKEASVYTACGNVN